MYDHLCAYPLFVEYCFMVSLTSDVFKSVWLFPDKIVIKLSSHFCQLQKILSESHIELKVTLKQKHISETPLRYIYFDLNYLIILDTSKSSSKLSTWSSFIWSYPCCACFTASQVEVSCLFYIQRFSIECNLFSFNC